MCGQGHTNPTQRKIEMFIHYGSNTLIHVNGQMQLRLSSYFARESSCSELESESSSSSS